jgi:hypothetical protein
MSMKTFASVLLLIGFATVISLAQSSAPDPKQEALNLQPGTYYWTGVAWQPMQQTNFSGSGLKKVGKLFVPGLTPQMVWTFRDARAPVQLKDGNPLFCYKFVEVPPGTPFAPSSRDIVIARFDEKKDHRELQTTSGGTVFTFKSGLSKERSVELTITDISSTLSLISPKEPLKPGEYLLTGTSLAISGYDFGFHPPNK